MNKSFYAILTADVRYDKTISSTAKLLFAEITALTNEKGYCWATNAYFGELFDMNLKSISRIISDLEQRGYIRTQLLLENKRVIERRIYITQTPITINEDIPKNEEIPKNEDTPPQKCGEGIPKNEDTPLYKNVETPLHKNVEVKDINNKGLNIKGFNNKENIKVNKKINKKSATETEFEFLWKMYPRKQGSKKKALKSYSDAIKKGDVTFEIAKNGLEMYVSYIQIHNISEEYIKHAATWFNQECWSNEYDLTRRVKAEPTFTDLCLNELNHYHQNSEVEDFNFDLGREEYDEGRNNQTVHGYQRLISESF